jgi:hypothetical protein
MRESTATATRRSPAGVRRQADRSEQEFAIQGNTALAPERRPEPAGPERSRSRLRVAPPIPVSAPRAPFVALVLFVVVAGVLGILVLNTKINENAFRLANLQNQQTGLDQQEQQLSQQLADESSPTSLAAAARRLGLVPAGQPAFIQLPDGRVIGVPQPATGAPSITGQQSQAATAAGH